jgi:gliding motility-associated-like protein
MRLNLIHIIWFLYSVFVFNNSAYGQCDVAISSWDAASGDIVIEAVNSENCGCNEFTSEGTTCESGASSHVTNNATVSHLVLGLHVEGLDYNWMNCLTGVNHPGWTFKVFTLYGNQILESGDTWSANVYDTGAGTNDCWTEILANDSLCTELVIWQINLSRTASTEEGGWAVNQGFNQTQNYPDIDITNNFAINCAPPACDTVYVDVEVIEYLTDTVIEYVDVEWVTIDTLYITEVDTLIEYVQLPPDTVHEYVYDTIVLIETDTITEIEYTYLTDTVNTETVVYEYEYIFSTDTIIEYFTEYEYVDCETGEACDGGVIYPCGETSIFAPNAVTPNGDGWNDTWMVETDGECWGQWEVRIYNRWGQLVWISTSSIDEWDADVATGVYVYTITAHSSMNASVFEFNGTITVLY